MTASPRFSAAPGHPRPSILCQSLFGQMEWWLIRQFDAHAERKDRRRGSALLGGLDDRTLADIGYGLEDDYRIGHL